MKNTLAIIAVAIFAGVSLLLIGPLQTAKADVPSNANGVAQNVNNNGISPHQRYMEMCKESQTAQSCATDSFSSNGAFTKRLAHSVNGP